MFSESNVSVNFTSANVRSKIYCWYRTVGKDPADVKKGAIFIEVMAAFLSASRDTFVCIVIFYSQNLNMFVS